MGTGRKISIRKLTDTYIIERFILFLEQLAFTIQGALLMEHEVVHRRFQVRHNIVFDKLLPQRSPMPINTVSLGGDHILP